VNARAADTVRKTGPQVECGELTTTANNITVSYAQTLRAATPSNLPVHASVPRELRGVAV